VTKTVTQHKTQTLINGLENDRAAYKLIRFDKIKALVDTFEAEIRERGYTVDLQASAGQLTLLIKYAVNRAKSEHSRWLNERNMNYGAEEEIAPTKFGNVGLTAQAYTMRAYQCNLVRIWSALRRVAEKDENTAKAFENCKSQLDYLVACFWLSLVLATEWALLLASRGDWFWAVTAATTGPLICWLLWYGAAVEQYRVLQDLISSSFNALRFQVLTDLRFPLPIDLAEERELWRAIDFGIGNGEPLNLRYQYPKS